MEYLLPILVLGAALTIYILLRMQGRKKSPSDIYVCHLCGEKDCLCHKEEHH